MALDDVADDDRVENRLEVLDRRGALEPEVLQSGEAAQDQVVVEQFPGRAGDPGMKFDELAEGQGEYGELHVPADEVGGQFSGCQLQSTGPGVANPPAAAPSGLLRFSGGFQDAAPGQEPRGALHRRRQALVPEAVGGPGHPLQGAEIGRASCRERV